MTLVALALLIVAVAAAAVALRPRGVGRSRALPVVLVACLVGAGIAVATTWALRAGPAISAALGLPGPVAYGRVLPDTPRVVSAPPGVALQDVWHAPAEMPRVGTVAEVDIPGTASGFVNRPGWIYLPPAYLVTPRPALPVLVLLPGQPGGPGDWLDGGELARRMDRFAADHGGLAPVVVMPDDLGAEDGNPLCLDSRRGNAATYLTVDVPDWIRRTLQVDQDTARWAIGGLSHGGTCSLQMALQDPQLFPTFLDISGQDEPSLGDRAQTVAAAFGTGPDAAADFTAVNPLDELRTTRYPQTAGRLVAGSDDTEFGPQARTVIAALQAAKVPATLTVLPGGHTWDVWGPGLDLELPWLASRMGITR